MSLNRWWSHTLLLAVLSVSGVSFGADDQQGVMNCDGSPLELDCACVNSAYQAATSGLTTLQKKGALALVKSAMMIPGVEHDEESFQSLMPVFEQVQPLMMVQESCKPSWNESNSVSTESMNDIDSICQSSPLLMDCGCVTYHFVRTADGLPEAVQGFLLNQVADQLRVPSTQTGGASDSAIVVHYIDLLGEFDGLRETCAVASPTGLDAARTANKSEDASLDARARASAADSMRLWCQAESRESPAFCACQVQMYSELISPDVFRFQGESLRALAAARAGSFAESERYSRAGAAMGAEDPADMKRRSDVEFEQHFETVSLACHAAERDLNAGN